MIEYKDEKKMPSDFDRLFRKALIEQKVSPREAARNLLQDIFPFVDLSDIGVVNFYSQEGFPVSIRCVGRGKGFGSVVTPSLMTDFEAKTLSYFLKTEPEENVIQIVMEILQKAIFIKSKTFVSKEIKLLSEFVKTKKLRDCSFDKLYKEKTTEITVLSFTMWSKGNKRLIRAIPKKWTIHDIASFLLATGDLPTWLKAKQLADRNKNCFEKESMS